MDKPRLHSLVHFVDDFELVASDHARLVGAQLEIRDNFIVLRSGDVQIGFHPADHKSKSGSSVAYFVTEDLERTIERARTQGFELYRGPITAGDERVAQLRNERNVIIGYVEKQ